MLSCYYENRFNLTDSLKESRDSRGFLRPHFFFSLCKKENRGQIQQDLSMLQHVLEVSSFLRYNKIPLYVYTIFYLFILPLMGCNHLLAIVLNAVMNMSVQISSIFSSCFSSQACSFQLSCLLSFFFQTLPLLIPSCEPIKHTHVSHTISINIL